MGDRSTLRPAYFDIVMAMGPNGEFGLDGHLPWGHIGEDLKQFSRLTRGAEDAKAPNVLIMGRGTWVSLENKSLPRRLSVVISRDATRVEGEPYLIAPSLDAALKELSKLLTIGEVGLLFLIGGVDLILEGIGHRWCETIHVTRIKPLAGELKCDRRMSWSSRGNIPLNYETVDRRECIETDETGRRYMLTYDRIVNTRVFAHPENTYQRLMNDIIEYGTRRPNRTGTDTFGIWGAQLRFDLTRFPLFTTKRIFWRGVVAELLFFLSGRTQTRVLEAQNVTIWTKNTTREFLDAKGLRRYEEGEAGPHYAFQWRHFGHEYRPNEQLELGQGGFDQITQVIADIKAVKANPTREEARRLLVTAWNPSDLKKACVPPCHYSFQFQVDGDRLNCMANMRSVDCPVGLPFNVASYALLTYAIGHLTGLTPGILVMSLADTHVYTNVIDQVKEQLCRPPRPWPHLEIVGQYNSIDDFTADSFRLVDYYPHPTLKMDMAV
jgi:dihydrofolate reductase / thymidylate synthase